MNNSRAFTISAERKSKGRSGADGSVPSRTIIVKNPPNMNKIGHMLISACNNMYIQPPGRIDTAGVQSL